MVKATIVKIKVGSIYPPATWKVDGWKCPMCKKEWLEEKDGGVNICHCGFDRRKKYYLREVYDMKVLINQDIWDKASEINKNRDYFKRYLWACKDAGLCPKCGEAMKYYIIPLDKPNPNICTKCDWREDAI